MKVLADPDPPFAMSLLTAFLRDSLFQTMVSAATRKAEVWIAVRSDGANGAGTFDDPYNSTKFDDYMADAARVPANATIRLMASKPGSVFKTKGLNVGTSTGWLRSGQRVVGEGMFNTVLQLDPADPPQGGNRTVIGNPLADFLDGFELSDLTIDCNLDSTATNPSAGAVALTGRFLSLRRLRIINHGNRNNARTTPIVHFRRGGTTVGEEPVGCLAENCVLAPISAQSTQAVVCFRCEGLEVSEALYNQRDATIRNCRVDGGAVATTVELTAFAALNTAGMVIEANQALNCRHGGPKQAEADVAANSSLIFRENYLNNIRYGTDLSLGSNDLNTGKRIELSHNQIDLPVQGTEGEPIGVRLASAASDNYRFQDVVLANNTVRHLRNAEGSAGAYGIKLGSCKNTATEGNIVTVKTANNSVWQKSCASARYLDNQTSAGVLRQGYNDDTGRLEPDLINDAQDTLLAI